MSMRPISEQFYDDGNDDDDDDDDDEGDDETNLVAEGLDLPPKDRSMANELKVSLSPQPHVFLSAHPPLANAG